jgi:LEA14-like dessication related protein
MLVVTLLSCALMTGCASIRDFSETPRVSVSDMRLVEATLLEQVYVVTVRIQNPSDRPLTLLGGSFDLEVNGREFGHGLSDTQATVPPFGDARIEVRMVSTLFDMVRLIQGLQARGHEILTYELSGWLKVDEFFGRVGVYESGELSLPKRSPRDNPAEPTA